MCGIIGVFGKNVEIKPEQIDRALAALTHRGPDEKGVWQDQDKSSFLAHTRLSIIDLEGGQQPLISPDGNYAAVVNGEFYDYENIRNDLIDWGYTFRTESDSEILLGLYARYGMSCLEYLRGEFAFILWDRRNRWAFAARDYFGIKPLFYSTHNTKLFLASEVKALKELAVPMQWNSVEFYQSMNMAPSIEDTLFANIKQIPPGHYLVKSWGTDQPHINKYWDFNYPQAQDRKPIREEEALEGFRDVFKEAISLRLKADVPVGCYLSGGLDSCSILGLAQELSQQTIQSFTLTFDHADYDEAQQAEEMAQFCGSKHHKIPISQRDIAENWHQAVIKAERFLFNGHGVAKYLLSREVQKSGLKVVLTGEGADEIFGGYAHFRQDDINYGRQWAPAERSKMLQQLEEKNKISNGLLLGNGNLLQEEQIMARLGYIPGWLRGFSHQAQLSQVVLDDGFKESYQTMSPVLYMLSQVDFMQLKGREKLDQSLYLWSKIVLPYYLLTVLGDRMEMAHSIEGRVPFLDHKLVEYVVQLPPELKIKKLTEKYLLREAAKPFISKTIYKRQKHPFLAPPSQAKNQPPHMQELIQDTLRGQALSKIPFIDQKKVHELLDREKKSPSPDMSKDILLLNLVSASALQQEFQL